MTRKKKRNQPLPSNEAQASALETFRPLLDAQDFASLQEELQRPLYPAFRSNPLKIAPGDEQRWSERYNWEIEPIPYCASGWWVKRSPEAISQTLEHRMGHYYIQDAASMLPVELFDIPPGSRPLILDMAASPGGKTTHLVSRTLDRGLVVANDSGLDRMTALRMVMQTWGATNIAATRFAGEKFGRWYPNTFDLILLDAPCSMQSLRSTESHPMRAISNREQNALASRQTALLASAFTALRPGGQLVYSTCTLAPIEDEAVLNNLVNLFPHAAQILPLEKKLPGPAPALASADGLVFNPQVTNAARLWPHRFHTSGFFAALITKSDRVDSKIETPPFRALQAVGQIPLTTSEVRQINRVLKDHYKHDLAQILEEQDLELWRSSSAIYAIPRIYLDRFNGLPCQLLGLKVAEIANENWLPSHEWVARFGKFFSQGNVSIPAEHIKDWLAGKDLPLEERTGFGEEFLVIVKDQDQRVLGRGKIQGGWLKNLLPRRLV